MKEKIEEKTEKEQMPNEKKQFFKGLLSGLTIALLVVSLVCIGKQIKSAGFLRSDSQESNASSQSEPITSGYMLQKMAVLQKTIEQYYLDEVKVTDMQEGAYRGILQALGDPYSTYYSAEELVEVKNQTQGIYYGIGAYIGMDAKMEMPVLAKIIEGTSAEESGLKDGDIIVKVGDVYTKGMDTTEVVSLVKGKEGTKAELTIYREGETDYLHFEVERRKLEIPTVEYQMLDNGIAYIEIREFDDVTIDQFREAYVMAQGNGMKGMILDLRSNPGGNLTAVTEIARMMLPKGLIVYTEDKYGERIEYSCDGKEEIQVPLVVLINGNSASASEILAGAIKDYGIGTLVGTTTFGKGIVQKIITLSDESAIKITVSKYYTPKGNNIHDIGIEPDEVVEFDGESYLKDGTDNQLNRAIEILKEKM